MIPPHQSVVPLPAYALAGISVQTTAAQMQSGAAAVVSPTNNVADHSGGTLPTPASSCPFLRDVRCKCGRADGDEDGDEGFLVQW